MSTDPHAPGPLYALSLRQPAASLLASGWLRSDERGWATGYRGVVAIHAAVALDAADFALFDRPNVKLAFRARLNTKCLADAPRGCVIGAAVLTGCDSTSDFYVVSANEAMFHPLLPNRSLLRFARPRLLTTAVYCRGGTGLFLLPDAEAAAVRRQLEPLYAPLGRVVPGPAPVSGDPLP